jgi:hypothetical protein
MAPLPPFQRNGGAFNIRVRQIGGMCTRTRSPNEDVWLGISAILLASMVLAIDAATILVAAFTG